MKGDCVFPPRPPRGGGPVRRAAVPFVKGPLWLVVAALLPGGCRKEDSAVPLGVESPYTVRVQVVPDRNEQISLRAPGTVRISTLPDLVLRFEGPLPDPAQIRAEGEGFRIAAQFYPSPIRLSSPAKHPLSLKAPAPAGGRAGSFRSYRGSIDLFNLNGRIRAINELPLEEYLAGVVGGEMPGDFPAAALESQAIASRTFTIYHLRQRERSAGERGLGDALDATSDFQVYAGLSGENPAARKAVQATAGWVLTYQGKVFPSYYHSTCGGNTTNGAWVHGCEDIPPLRGVPCGGCNASPTYRWKLTLPLRQLESFLRPWADARKLSLGELRGLSGVEPLPGGYLRYLKVEHSGGSFEIRSDRFRSLLIRNGIYGLRSTSFEVGRGADPRTLEFRGAGWGHGVGMCQYGAARRGRSEVYGQILAYYYPESEIKKVY